jgi:hypothetical protein
MRLTDGMVLRHFNLPAIQPDTEAIYIEEKRLSIVLKYDFEMTLDQGQERVQLLVPLKRSLTVKSYPA